MRNYKMRIKDADTKLKIKSLAEYLEVPESDIKQTYDENHFEVISSGEEYFVSDYDTAYAEGYQDFENLFDDIGFEMFRKEDREYWLYKYIDLAGMYKEIVSMDGLGNQLAQYDGDELELSNDLYAYRQN